MENQLLDIFKERGIVNIILNYKAQIDHTEKMHICFSEMLGVRIKRNIRYAYLYDAYEDDNVFNYEPVKEFHFDDFKTGKCHNISKHYNRDLEIFFYKVFIYEEYV